MGDIKALNTARPNEHIAELLDDLQAMNERGELVSIAFASVRTQGETMEAFYVDPVCGYPQTLVGTLEMLKHIVMVREIEGIEG